MRERVDFSIGRTVAIGRRGIVGARRREVVVVRHRGVQHGLRDPVDCHRSVIVISAILEGARAESTAEVDRAAREDRDADQEPGARRHSRACR